MCVLFNVFVSSQLRLISLTDATTLYAENVSYCSKLTPVTDKPAK